MKTTRKKTVTVTLGPKTEALLQAMREASMAVNPAFEFDTTGQVGGLFTLALGRMAKDMGVKLPAGWGTHFD
jgi:hypothetical protein